MKVVGLYRYPVKSLRGTSLQRSSVHRIGLAEDRRWLIVDAEGKFLTIRQQPIMTQIGVTVTEDGIIMRHASSGQFAVSRPAATAALRKVTIWRDTVTASVAEPSSNGFFSNILGQKVHLVYLNNQTARPIDPMFGQCGDHTSFSDGYPILITTTSSLRDLNRHLTDPVDMRRFRPNIVIDNTMPWIEDTWKVVRIGTLTFRIAKPCGRCVVTTRDPDTGEQADPAEPLKTLGNLHRAANGNIVFGQNIIPNEEGVLRAYP
ncbi:MAG: MOSC domain-containing protein [Fimbriimonadaceae bacterium]|nr:MOSC domain-containing protein [Alphaproteobacteria bacterium]